MVGMYLHMLYWFREINNRFSNRIISSERFIRKWADTVVALGIKESEYQTQENIITKSISEDVLAIYRALIKANPSMKVMAMSQSFAIGQDPIERILGIDIFESNQFITNQNGRICGFFLNVRNAYDKKRIAERVISRLKPRQIGLFVEDYDDYLLLSLKNVGFILHKKRLKRFIKHNDKLVLISF